MKTLLLLLSAVLSLQCVTSQITMVESGPGIVRPSETLDLTCKVTGAFLTDSINMHCVTWIRQPEGKGLEWLGMICYENMKYYDLSFKERFSLSRDTNKGEVYSKLTGVRPEESGTYYCARLGGVGGWPYYFDIWGPGTLVTVTSAQVIIPAVYPVIAVGHTGSTSTSVACLVNRFLPPPVSVTWDTTKGEKLSGVKDIMFPLSGDPPAYNLLSQVTINKNDWDSKTYQCNVSFRSTNIVKIIPKVYDPLPEAPTVHLLQGNCPESNGEIELTCQVYNLTSQDATLKWYINDQERRFAENKLELGKSQNHYFALHSTVTIGQSEWNNGVRVKCHVTDTNTNTTAEGTIKKCSESFNCLGIHVFIVPPSIEDLYVHNTARIICVASNLKDTNENYSFDWSFPRGSDLNIQTEDSQLHNNGTYSMSSVLTVPPDVWLQETEFTCLFRHSGLQEPIITRLKKEKVTKTSQPVVSVYPPSTEELAQKETCTLLCLSSKFNPSNIFMGWTENDLEVSKDLYVNSKPMLETGGKTYFMISKLTIPASSWDSGFSYGCLVGQETIPNNFTRISIDKNSGKPTVVNVSVKMSDVTLSCY